VRATVYQPPEYAEAGLITAGITLARRMYQVLVGTGNEQVSRVYHISFAGSCCGMLAVLSLEIAAMLPRDDDVLAPAASLRGDREARAHDTSISTRHPHGELHHGSWYTSSNAS